MYIYISSYILLFYILFHAGFSTKIGTMLNCSDPRLAQQFDVVPTSPSNNAKAANHEEGHDVHSTPGTFKTLEPIAGHSKIAGSRFNPQTD